jgi:CBS domain-containing protein
MTVSRILAGKGRDVIGIAPQKTLADAAKLLSERRIGAVMVIGENDAMLGILSERDIVRALAENGADALTQPVSQRMTKKVVSCNVQTTINDVMQMMTTGKFRHMPVIENGKVHGVISIGDVVKQRIAEVEAESSAMRSYIGNA